MHRLRIIAAAACTIAAPAFAATFSIDRPQPIDASNQAAYVVSGDCVTPGQGISVNVAGPFRNSPAVTTPCGIDNRFSATLKVGMVGDGGVMVNARIAGSTTAGSVGIIGQKLTSVRWRHAYSGSLDGFATDLVWRHASGAQGYWLMPQGTAALLPSLPNGGVIALANFSGIDHGDLLWRDGSGDYFMSVPHYTGCGSCGAPPFPGIASDYTMIFQADGSGREIAGVGNFDGSRTDDILWKLGANGYEIWLMNGTTVVASAAVGAPGPGYTPALIADFDGDGKSDILWTHADGSVVITLMNGVSVSQSRQVLGPGTGWTPMLTGDFNADDKADILWKHADGSWGLWLQNGVNILNATLLPNRGPGNGWNARFIRDFDGDGFGDILWESADGAGAYEAWRMSGLSVLETKSLLAGGSGWHVYASSDYSGDGLDDLLWRSDAGDYGVWYMNGLTPTTVKGILPGGTGWEVVR